MQFDYIPKYPKPTQAIERWLPIPGFEDRYLVSSLGKVKSTARWHRKEDLQLKGRMDRDGYLKVVLWIDGVPHPRSMHRLVMLAFVGPSSLHVNHINGMKDENDLNNLEYVTPAENRAHAKHNGLVSTVCGENHHNAKLSDADVRAIREIGTSMFQKDIAKQFGVNRTIISMILSGKSR